MSSSVDEAVQEMKKFIDECHSTREAVKRDRSPKLKELIERLYKKYLKEEKDDEAIQEMAKFIDECNKTQEELKREHSLKLTELVEKLDNFKVKSVYGQVASAAREVMKA